MAVSSTMLELGTQAPGFSLPDVITGKSISLDSFSGQKAVLVMFICQHCPYVKHVEKHLALLGEEYIPKGVGIVGISSNDVANYPEDSPNHLKEMAENLKFSFPVCYDESQETAKAYRAACTPEFYLFDKDRKLVYRGQLDDSRPKNNVPVTGKDLRSALEGLLSGAPPLGEQKPGIGCNIKWKRDNEPDYFSR